MANIRFRYRFNRRGLTIIQLKQAIEEIVAPLPADPRLKDRYREELLGHLIALVEDEHTQGRDNAATLEVALNRLGDPESLRTNFTESLSRLDRAYGKACHAFEKQPDESSLRFASRGCGYFALGISLFTATLLAPTIVGITWFKGPDPCVMVLLPIFGLFVVLYSSPTLFFGLLLDARTKKARVKGEWGAYTLYGFVLLVLSILSGTVCMGIGHVLLVSFLGNHHLHIYTFFSYRS